MMDVALDRRRRAQLLIVRGLFLALFSLLAAWLAAHDARAPQRAIAGLLLAWGLASLPLLPASRLGKLPAPALGHLLLDALMLFLLLYCTGGYANPLVSLFLFPVLIAGLTLPARRAWIVGGAVILAYSLLVPFHHPLPMMQGMARGFHLHLLGMWLTFVMTVVMLLTVVVRMSEERRLREAQMAELRQRALRDRDMLALGAQAASDAHELGTPVNSLMLLLDQWPADALDEMGRERVARMREQLTHCRDVLARLADRARNLCEGGNVRPSASAAVRDAVHQWRNLHPSLPVELSGAESARPAPAGTLLEQAVFILLDNALEAGASHAWVRLDDVDSSPRLSVEDDGPGFDDSILARSGRTPLTTREDGKGLGLYLLRYLAEHAGGNLKLENRPEGGARVILDFPTGGST